LPMRTFEYTWARSDYWAMATLPPDRIPRTAEENRFIAAVSALEKVGYPERAYSAYISALKRWPGSLVAQIGAGNTAYRMHDLVRAEAAFRQIVLDHPDSVAALNNLAQTLSDQGRHAEALPFAQHAVGLGGPLAELAKATLAEIESKLRQ